MHYPWQRPVRGWQARAQARWVSSRGLRHGTPDLQDTHFVAASAAVGSTAVRMQKHPETSVVSGCMLLSPAGFEPASPA